MVYFNFAYYSVSIVQSMSLLVLTFERGFHDCYPFRLVSQHPFEYGDDFVARHPS